MFSKCFGCFSEPKPKVYCANPNYPNYSNYDNNIKIPLYNYPPNQITTPEFWSFGQFHLIVKKNRNNIIICNGDKSKHKCLGINLHNDYILGISDPNNKTPKHIFSKIYTSNDFIINLCENAYNTYSSHFIKNSYIKNLYGNPDTHIILPNNDKQYLHFHSVWNKL